MQCEALGSKGTRLLGGLSANHNQIAAEVDMNDKVVVEEVKKRQRLELGQREGWHFLQGAGFLHGLEILALIDRLKVHRHLLLPIGNCDRLLELNFERSSSFEVACNNRQRRACPID